MKERDTISPAFVMEPDDRFCRAIVADPVRYAQPQPEAETLLAFFVVRRAVGTFEIVHITRTFLEGKLASRNVQTKPGIPASVIDEEVDNVRIGFALGVERATGYKLRWHELDLSGVTERDEQVAQLREWDKFGVWQDTPFAS